MSEPTFYQFHEEYNILVDEQGIMLPLSNVKAIMEECEKHMAHSKLELEALGRRTVTENHPRMVDQFNFEGYFE